MAERPIAIEEVRTAVIFRTAAEIFQRKGYHATAMGEIADAVDLTKAGLYYYVKGKEDLLFAIVSFAMDRLEAWVEAARACPGPEQRLRSIITNHALGITLDGNAITLLVDETEALAPERRERIRRRQRAYYEFIRDNLAELGAAGRSEIDPSVGAFGILGLLMWLARWYKRDGELAGEEVARQITRMALEGVLTGQKIAGGSGGAGDLVTKQGTGGDAARREDIG
jgi:AcrR family transcriptional regulator